MNKIPAGTVSIALYFEYGAYDSHFDFTEVIAFRHLYYSDYTRYLRSLIKFVIDSVISKQTLDPARYVDGVRSLNISYRDDFGHHIFNCSSLNSTIHNLAKTLGMYPAKFKFDSSSTEITLEDLF